MAAEILRERGARDRASRGLPQLLAEPELHAVANQRLGQRRRLNQEEPPEVRARELARRVAIQAMRGHDVEDRERADALRMVERHAMRDAAAAIVLLNEL